MAVGIQEAGGVNYWVEEGTEISDADTRPVYLVPPARNWPAGCSAVAIKLSRESFRGKWKFRLSDYSGWSPRGKEQMTDCVIKWRYLNHRGYVVSRHLGKLTWMEIKEGAIRICHGSVVNLKK
jgi:hypothetical protein